MGTSTQPLVVERHQSDLANQDHATEQTVQLMAREIRKSAADPLVQAAARSALLKYSQGRAGAYAACWAAWWSVRHNLKFVSDDKLLRGIPTPNPPEMELLVSPMVMVRSREPQGDCDDFTMMLCALLQCLGVRWEIVTVAADPGDPERWSHVYAVATLEGGARWVMDAAPPDAKFPGWEVPADRMFRYQVWDQDGRRVARPHPIKRMGLFIRGGFAGMGAAVPRTRLTRRRRGMRGMRGLGDTYECDQDGANCVTIPDPVVSSGGDSWVSFSDGTGCVLGSAQCPVAGASSSGALSTNSSNAFTNELNTLLNSWTQIGSRVIAPTTTYTGPNGVSITTPAGNSTVAALLSSVGLGTSSMNTILMLGGAALLLVLLMSKK